MSERDKETKPYGSYTETIISRWSGGVQYNDRWTVFFCVYDWIQWTGAGASWVRDRDTLISIISL